MPSDAPEANLIASLMDDSDQLRSENNRLRAILSSKESNVSSSNLDSKSRILEAKIEEMRNENNKFRNEVAVKYMFLPIIDLNLGCNQKMMLLGVLRKKMCH